MPQRVNRHIAVSGDRKLSVREMTDVELRGACLHTTHPSEEPNLSTTPPPEDEPLLFEMTYWAESNVSCVFKNHQHLKGILLRDENGTGFLIGNCCGKKVYGLDWKQMDRERETLQESQKDLLRGDEVSQAIAKSNVWLETLSKHPAVLAFDAARRELRANAPMLFQSLRYAVERREGKLFADMPERDFHAEQRKRVEIQEELREFSKLSPGEQKAVAKHHAFLKDEPIFKFTTTHVATVYGASIITCPRPLAGDIAGATTQILRLPAVLTGASRATRGPFLTQASHLIGAVKKYLSLISEGCDFFKPEPLEQLARWGNAQTGARIYQVIGDELICMVNDEPVFRLKRPANLRPIKWPDELAKVFGV